MRLDRTITLGCIACGGLAMNNTVPLCQICHEDVRAGGDSAVERIHAIAQLQREEREYR